MIAVRCVEQGNDVAGDQPDSAPGVHPALMWGANVGVDVCFHAFGHEQRVIGPEWKIAGTSLADHHRMASPLCPRMQQCEAHSLVVCRLAAAGTDGCAHGALVERAAMPRNQL